MYDKPSEQGLYWARTAYSKKWNYIIRIKGESPFLNYIGWDLNYPLHEPTVDNSLVGINPTKFIFENKINCDYDYSNNWKNKQTLTDVLDDLQKTANKTIIQSECLYWAISKPEGDPLLVYIKGMEPYMSCFVWNVLFNTRKQKLEGNDLIYLTQIEKPKDEEE